jgi:ubiquinone/menaquinone biosynthesis C-methylase UbiE
MRIAVIAVLACGALAAQVAEKANERYQTPESRAKLMEGITSATRDARQKPKELVAALGIRPGMVVVDLGTGGGYMLPYLSAAAGPAGKVIAQDIFPDFLDSAKRRAAELNLKNVEFVRGDEKSTGLPSGVADLILVLDVYHHFNYPQQMLADLGRALKPDGRLAIVEYHRNEESMGRNGFALQHIRLGEEEAIKEIEAAGWKLLERKDFIPRVQWLGVFSRQK